MCIRDSLDIDHPLTFEESKLRKIEAHALIYLSGIGIVFHCKHNNKIHSYLQSLNPILKILKFKYLNTAQSLFKPFPRNQLAINGQSFPRKSSNTAYPMIARHAKDFT